MLIPLLIINYYLRNNYNNPKLFYNVPTKLILSWKSYLHHLLFFLRLIAIVLIIIALARPQSTNVSTDVLDKKGVYDGGVITPGIDLSLKSLQMGTAKLPLVNFKKTNSIVGKCTKEAIQSGFFWGYVSMIQGLIHRIQLEKKTEFQIILTGGNSKYFKGCFENVINIDEYFNSKGLNYLTNTYLKKL